MADAAANVAFYTRTLGFRLSDAIDFAPMVPEDVTVDETGGTKGYFLRHGTEHHSYVVFPKATFEAATHPAPPGVTANQLTWQLGSLQEVVAAIEWFDELGLDVVRTGRDFPGSNWHAYLPDPDGNTVEVLYGIEQIGWSGHTKPFAMHDRIFHTTPSLPQISEEREVDDALAAGVSLVDGHRHREEEPACVDVQGVLLPRPFKIVRIGPISLYVRDLHASIRWYTDVLGLTETERVSWGGHDIAFLRCGTEHHSLALLPIELRDAVGTSDHTTLGPIGLQVANYRQLCDALTMLEDDGHEIVDLPPAVHTGSSHAAGVRDVDGHLLSLYWEQEQIGWDGRPRPAEQRRPAGPRPWPTVLEATSDTYAGEPFLGPWG